MSRQEVIDKLRSEPEIDVLVIGGGVNGIGTFRDLALQGVRIVLAEKGDFCSGASAASSHMLHGGIRYLENGEFRLVREALHERNLMLKNAPHYARPMPTTIPIFRWFSGLLNAPLKFLGWLNRPAERGAVVIKLGLMMYDLFTGPQQTMPKHKFMLKKASLQQYPRMSQDIVCTATYYDAWMPYPERICMELIRDAEESSSQAHALNYFSASGSDDDAVLLTDVLTGETVSVRPRVVINAAGPWIDFVNKAMEVPTRFIGGTKGSHLILDHPELLEAINGHEIFFENDDGRIVLIFPYFNRVMVGTTDIRIDDPEEAVCTQEEIDYMLGMVDRVFPDIKVTPSQIVYRFSGVRPLPASDANNPGQISRDHSVRVVEPESSGLKYPIYSLVGGKWTSFRAFAQQVTDQTLSALGRTRQANTEMRPFGGGKGYPLSDQEKQEWLQDLHDSTGLPVEHLSTLLDRYGTYAADVAHFVSAGEDQLLEHTPGYTRREVMFVAEHEKVMHLADFVMRRSLLAMLGYLTIQPALIDELAGVVGEALGWTPDQVRQEAAHTRKILAEKHGVVAEPA